MKALKTVCIFLWFPYGFPSYKPPFSYGFPMGFKPSDIYKYPYGYVDSMDWFKGKF